MSALDEHLKKHRKKIIDREKKTFRELLAAYQDTERELAEQYDELYRKIKLAQENGEEISVSWFYREQRLKNLLSQSTEQIIRFGEKTAKIIEREQREAIKIAAVQSKETFEILTENSPDIRSLGSMLNPRAVETAVGMMGDGSPILEYFQKQLAPMVAEKIKSEVIKASAIGTDFRTMGKRLEAAGGITKHRALTTARSETNRVRRAATLEIYRENDDIIEGWQWCSSKSRRTCPVCLAMDGRVFKLKDEFPQHPNCRCQMIAVIEGLPRRKRTIGSDWFDEQPDAIKEEILGKEAFLAFQNGDVELKDFVGWKNDKRFGRSVYRKPLMTVLQSKPMKVGAGGNWRRFDEKFDATILKQSDLSCVSTVGEMLLKNRGIDVSQDTIRDIIGVPAYVEALAMVLNDFDTDNLDGKIWRGFTTDLDGLNLLVKLKNVGVIMKEPLERLGHAVFLDGKTRSGLFKIKDPFDQTSYKMTEKDFWENWGGQVIARWYPKK